MREAEVEGETERVSERVSCVGWLLAKDLFCIMPRVAYDVISMDGTNDNNNKNTNNINKTSPNTHTQTHVARPHAHNSTSTSTSEEVKDKLTCRNDADDSCYSWHFQER